MSKLNVYKPAEFTEEILEKILENNNRSFIYECFKSSSVFEIHCGAKNVSKIFYNAIITMYKIINNDQFNSVWYTDDVNKSKNILRPIFNKALEFLKDKYNLDYTGEFLVSKSGVFYYQKDSGTSRGVYFENWKKDKSFELIRLPKLDYFLGEIVIVDLIKPEAEISSEFEKDQEKRFLSLLISDFLTQQNIENFANLKFKFIHTIYNIQHLLVRKFHNKILPLLDKNNNVKIEYIRELLNKPFVKREKTNFKNGLGGIVVHYTKNSVEENLNELQKRYLNNLKKESKETYLFEYTGIYTNKENKYINYYLRDPIFKNSSDYDKSFVKPLEELKDKSIVEISDGINIGRRNQTSWVRVAKLANNNLVVLDYIEDIKKFSKDVRDGAESEVRFLLNYISESNNELIENFKSKIDRGFLNNFKTKFVTDNMIVAAQAEEFNNFKNKKYNQSFSVIKTFMFEKVFNQWQKDKHEWEKNAFYQNLMHFSSTAQATVLIDKFSKIAIKQGEKERDEQINPDVYNLVEAFEFSVFGTNIEK